MMQKLKEEITAAANRELNRANEQFPLFTSKHEGVAVAYEELEESKEALEELEASFKCFEYDGQTEVSIDGKRYAVYRTYGPKSNRKTELYIAERVGKG